MKFLHVTLETGEERIININSIKYIEKSQRKGISIISTMDNEFLTVKCSFSGIYNILLEEIFIVSEFKQ